MAGEDDLELRATMDDAVSSVLARIEARIETTERKLDDLSGSGREAGAAVQEGAEQGEEALKREGDQADKTSESLGKTREESKKLGDETEKTSKKTDKSTSAWDKWEKKLAKTSKTFGGFSWLMKTFKITAMVGAVFAAAGAVSALGAGAVIAVGGIGAMLPGLAALGPIAVAAKLGIKAFSLAAEELDPQMTRLKGQFDGVGKAVAKGGLAKGLDYLNKKMKGFSTEVTQGMGWIGGSLGIGAHALGDFLNQGARLDQTEKIFWSLSNIIETLVPGTLKLGGGIMSLFTASLPAGERLAGILNTLASRFGVWADAQAASGRATQVINKGLDMLVATARTVSNFVIGLYNIFKIAAGFAGDMGLGIDNLSQKFRAWTSSVEGQASIKQYFQDAMPAIKEAALLVGDLLKMLGGLSTSSDIAPLLNQLRTEFLPVLGELLTKMSGAGGLLPVLIDAATAVAGLFAKLDPSALQILVDGFAGLVDVISWLSDNVPGADSALSALFTGLLLVGPLAKVGETITGVIDSVTGLGDTIDKVKSGFETGKEYYDNFMAASEEVAAMKEQIQGAIGWTKGLVAEGSFLHGPFNKAKDAVVAFGTMLKTQAVAGLTAVRTAALVTWDALMGPLGLVILAIIAVIAVIIYLWNNCEWFRDAVTAVWEWIKNAAVVAWEWIKNAVVVTIQVISAIVTWLWENIIKPVLDFMVAYWTVVFTVIAFVVQTVVYIIVGIITVMALILQGIWWVISTVAVWVWQNVIWPVIQFVVGLIIAIFNGVVGFFVWVWGMIVQQAQFAWNLIMMAVNVAVALFMMIWTPLVAFFTWLFGVIGQANAALWSAVQTAVTAVVNFFRPVWEPIGTFFAGLFSGIGKAGTSIFKALGDAASAVADVVKSVWNGVLGIVKGAYNGIANGWNSIPDITVPDWVPLIGGQTFGLPKLPTLWHGGTIEYGTAIVGEHGPEPLLGASGQYLGMLGANGPEVATGLPKGGYVVPNLSTLTSMPGLLKGLPSGVGDAVSRSVPGYADLLGGGTTVIAPPPGRSSDAGERELVAAVRGLTRAVAERPPPISADGADTEAQILRALRRHDRERELASRYNY